MAQAAEQSARMIRQILREAEARVADRTLPLAVRIRSKETVLLCQARLAAEARS